MYLPQRQKTVHFILPTHQLPLKQWLILFQLTASLLQGFCILTRAISLCVCGMYDLTESIRDVKCWKHELHFHYIIFVSAFIKYAHSFQWLIDLCNLSERGQFKLPIVLGLKNLITEMPFFAPGFCDLRPPNKKQNCILFKLPCIAKGSSENRKWQQRLAGR